MVISLSDLKPDILSDEELLELGKISSVRSTIVVRFLEQNLKFRYASLFVACYASILFIVSPFLFVSETSSIDIIADSYHELFIARLLIVFMLGAGALISFIDGRVFKGFLLSLIIAVGNYSIDMFYFYNEYLSQSAVSLKVLYYTRPLVFVALLVQYFNYNKS